MVSSRDRDAIFSKFISDSLDVKGDIIHLAELLIGTPVVGPRLGRLLHPLVTMFTLAMITFSRPHQKPEGLTRPLV